MLGVSFHICVQAGIASPENPEQLIIALEPEAASIYVRKQRLHQLIPESPMKRRRSSPYRRSLTPEPTSTKSQQGNISGQLRTLLKYSSYCFKYQTPLSVTSISMFIILIIFTSNFPVHASMGLTTATQ